MASQHCPYCFHIINAKDPWFQCNGRGTPEKSGCAVTIDHVRERLTGFYEQARPSFAARVPFRASQAACPDCGGATSVRVCPTCHTPLPVAFFWSPSPLICVAGAKGVGKTVYLTVLLHSMINAIGRRFDADVRTVSSWSRTDQIRWELASLFEHGLLPMQTSQALRGIREPHVMEWRAAAPGRWPRRFRGSTLSFYDIAGEDLMSLEDSSQLRYLSAAGGLILLIDPLSLQGLGDTLALPPEARTSSESAVETVARVTDTLRMGRFVGTAKRINVPVAVVLTKFDMLFELLGADHPLLRKPAPEPHYDEAAGQATHEQVRALLHEWNAGDIDIHLKVNYADFRYFVVSSLGWPPDYRTAALSPHGIAPFRVEEPLIWLLSRFGVVPSRRK